MKEDRRAYVVLAINTLAFTVCFACWMMNGVLITYLVDNGVYNWSESQIGWLIGLPVLTGSLTRLPVGILTDKYGGRIVYGTLMLLSAVPMFLMSYADGYNGFLLGSLGFGLTGASFAVGIAYTSVWFKREHQGTALGIFGAGNAGAALTSIFAPKVLRALTHAGQDLERWRLLPQYYAALLVVMAVIFFLFTTHKKVEEKGVITLAQRLAPLKHVRVWRFGLYYFLVFGGFVALAQWLVPYYVNVYGMTVAKAGMFAAIFSFPSGVIRAFGGWLSDKYGARRVMYGVLSSCLVACALLVVPRMDIQSPGKGVMCKRGGVVEQVTDSTIVVAGKSYSLTTRPAEWLSADERDGSLLIFPTSVFWQEPVVEVGQEIKKKELLAKGVTHIFFQANVGIFTALVFVVGFMMGIGKAAVYKHIPDYFPNDVGVVGGIVGVLGGLGGFCGPIIFGYLLQSSGIWTTCWMFYTLLTLGCLVWMHLVVQAMMRREAPELMREMDNAPSPAEPYAETAE